MDLSKVLGDVYETGKKQAPEWADEQKLDEAFSQWTPGPPADAPAAEREMARLDDDLAAALTEALANDGGASADPVPTFPEVEPEPDSVAAVLYAELAPLAEPAAVEVEADPEPVVPGRWARGDDDVAFGHARGGRRFGRR